MAGMRSIFLAALGYVFLSGVRCSLNIEVMASLNRAINSELVHLEESHTNHLQSKSSLTDNYDGFHCLFQLQKFLNGLEASELWAIKSEYSSLMSIITHNFNNSVAIWLIRPWPINELPLISFPYQFSTLGAKYPRACFRETNTSSVISISAWKRGKTLAASGTSSVNIALLDL